MIYFINTCIFLTCGIPYCKYCVADIRLKIGWIIRSNDISDILYNIMYNNVLVTLLFISYTVNGSMQMLHYTCSNIEYLDHP